MIFDNMLDAIGKTPILKAERFAKISGLKANIFLKLEMFNPAGSVKDRVAFSMVSDLEKKKLINKKTTLIEATSGNTGIGLAFVCAIKGYKLVLTMPDTMSNERRKLFKAYGAKLVLTKGSLGMKGAILKAEMLCKEMKNVIILNQFSNNLNPQAHFLTTGPEIWQTLNKKVDVFVAGIGTGGTITGAGKYLKKQNPKLVIVGVEPEKSAVLSGKKASNHKIQGIGAGFIPQGLKLNLLDYIVKVDEKTSFNMCKTIAKSEGLLVGISSGATLAGALQFLKKNPQFENKNIVCMLADGAEKYLSTELFD